jgi:hypothetical protein
MIDVIQLRKLTPIGATALAVGGGVRMLCAICEGSTDLNLAPMAQLLSRIGSVKSSKGRVCVMQDKKRAFALQLHQELASQAEAQERVRLFNATVDGGNTKANKLPRYTETALHEQCGWSVSNPATPGIAASLERNGEALDVSFLGSRHICTETAAQLMAQGWFVSRRKQHDASSSSTSSSSTGGDGDGSRAVDSIRPELDRLASEVASSKSDMSQLKLDIESVRGLASHLQQVLKSHTASTPTATPAAATSAAAEPREDYSARFADTNQSISSLQDQVTEVQQQTRKLHDSVESQHAEIKSLAGQLLKLVSTITKAKSRDASASASSTPSTPSVTSPAAPTHAAPVYQVEHPSDSTAAPAPAPVQDVPHRVYEEGTPTSFSPVVTNEESDDLVFVEDGGSDDDDNNKTRASPSAPSTPAPVAPAPATSASGSRAAATMLSSYGMDDDEGEDSDTDTEEMSDGEFIEDDD